MTVDELIVESLKRVAHLSNEVDGLGGANLNNLQTRLIYPRYGGHRAEEIRISEQEIKQIFIEVLKKTKENHTFLYSVECPTENKYIFVNEPDCLNCPVNNPNTTPEHCTITSIVINELEIQGENNERRGVSGRFDICLYNNYENNITRKKLIEFKYSNGVNKNFCKDLFKLAHELNDNTEAYFVLILDTFRNATKNSIFGGG